MAFWKRKTVKGKLYLFVYTRQEGRQKNVPRALYKHLDGAPDHNIVTWVNQWSSQNETAVVTPDHILFSDDRLNKNLGEWAEYLEKTCKRADTTISQYSSYLRRYAFPFFLERGLKDPAQWAGVGIRLFDYLKEYNCTQSMIRETNKALRSFYLWLQDEGMVSRDVELRLRNSPTESKETTLSFALTPEDVLEFVRSTSNWETQLLALAGYFFSLRSQESFALRPEDFSAGKDVTKKDCVVAMREAGLYARLAVNVTRQQSPTRKIKPPKAHSKGWVSCFNQEAAELLVALINDRPEGVQMLGADNRAIYRRWAVATKGGKLATIDLKDLRRASIYWLGHHSDLGDKPVQLMKHARHKEFDTTVLYLRRPADDEGRKPGKLKLGA